MSMSFRSTSASKLSTSLIQTQASRYMKIYGFGAHPYGDGWLMLPIADVRALLAEEDALSLYTKTD